LSAGYDLNVFINCPFDAAYLPVMQAIIFAVVACGLKPRCALEISDAGEVRIEKIIRIIRACRWGIHDISRTELSANQLPRFNMPLELGMFLGARRFGTWPQTQKSCLVLDREKYRYQAFISDIAGQDIAAHENAPTKAVKAVRDWLAVAKAGAKQLPGGAAMAKRLGRFMANLPILCAGEQREAHDLTFVDYVDAVYSWLQQDDLASAP
jgi:hypothetical protein